MLGDDDLQLMQAIGRGDKAAFSVFVARHANGLIRFAQRYLSTRADAEDAVQEALLRLWRSAPRWQDKGATPRSWVYQITYHICIDQLRRAPPAADEVDEGVNPTPSSEQDVLQNESAARVDQALRALPERQRSALMLCAFEGLSNKEAAAALSISVEALESLLARGRRSLRQQLLEETTNDRIKYNID